MSGWPCNGFLFCDPSTEPYTKTFTNAGRRPQPPSPVHCRLRSDRSFARRSLPKPRLPSARPGRTQLLYRREVKAWPRLTAATPRRDVVQKEVEFCPAECLGSIPCHTPDLVAGRVTWTRIQDVLTYKFARLRRDGHPVSVRRCQALTLATCRQPCSCCRTLLPPAQPPVPHTPAFPRHRPLQRRPPP